MDPTMESPPSINIKIISCKDLKAFNFFQKLTLYTLVSIASHDPKRELKEDQMQQQRTKTHRDGDAADDGGSPEWNHEARFDLGWVSPSLLEGSGDLFLRFEFRHDGVLLGDKIVGECRVPLADLLRDADGAARFVSYEVRNGEGKPNGIFNFAYKLNGVRVGIGIGIGNENNHHSSQILEGRISGYPVLNPEDCDPNQLLVQYPSTVGIESACCYPTVGSLHEGLVYCPRAAAVPSPSPPVSFPSFGECGCYYPPPPPQDPYPPPPLQNLYPPPPQDPYPPPPHVPIAQGVRYYPPFGPEAHPWASGPSFERRW